MHRPAPLTPTALRTRWALADLATGARRGCAADPRRAAASVTAMGIQFPSPLALAAGFDRHGVLIGRAGLLGLGSVEIGSVSAGSRELARALLGLRRCNGRSGAIHGISVVKRPATPWAGAAGEFLAVLHQLHGLADYVALNPGRDCPQPALFATVVAEVAGERDRLAGGGQRMPLVAKVPARWLATCDPAALGEAFAAHGADGLMLATDGHPGLHPIAILRRVAEAIGPEVCLISVGGAATPGDVQRRLRAGASLVQVHGALRRSNRRQWISRTAARLARP